MPAHVWPLMEVTLQIENLCALSLPNHFAVTMVQPLSFLIFHPSFLQLWMRLAWGGHALLGAGAAFLAAGKCAAMFFAAT